MQKIKSFLSVIGSARKRTGILFATGEFEAAVKSCIKEGYALTEAENQFGGTVFLTDDELLAKIKSGTDAQPILYIGLETFIGPRFEDAGFVEQLVKKLIVEEPLNPVIILLYSRRLFQIFSRQYSLHLTNQIHVLDLTTQETAEDEYA